jgi:KipI family sensor histidine kinase inhibitor
VRVLTAADTALLLEASDLEESTRMLPALETAALPGVCELVPGARTILVRFDPSLVAAGALAARLLEIEPVAASAGSDRSVTIPVRYDGQDLDEVARLLGVSRDELVERHLAATWAVAFTGFAPGFGYLIGDDPRFDVPRRPSPRPRIPAGSVALAGRYSGVYPTESPGGWQLIGRTDAALWDLERDPPALLAPGTSVRFVLAARELVGTAPLERRSAPAGGPVARHAVEIVRSGLQLLVQDLGRHGLAAQGVSASGAADRGALREANRAVGNPPHLAGLELAGGAAALRFRGPAVVALTGAAADARVLAASRRDAPIAVQPGCPVAIDDGDELRIGALRDGARVVIGIRGGIALEPVLGSLASDTLAGLGPAPLAAGDALPLHGPAAGTVAVAPTRAPRAPLPRAGETTVLGVVLGPRADWFTAAALDVLEQQEWEVTPRSDRVGLRLAGAVPIERARDGELESEGCVTGAIQVPPDGQPVLLLPDHPLTGGYPVIGAVVDRDLDLAGQLPAGARIRFRVARSPADQQESPCERS